MKKITITIFTGLQWFSFIFISISVFGISSVNFAQTAPQTEKFEVPKIYVGQDFLDKKEIFKYEKTKEEKAIPYATIVIPGDNRPPKINQDEFNLKDIQGVYAGEIDDAKGIDILAAGSTKAFILDLDGKVKKVIDYNLGTYSDGGLKQIYNIPFISFADVDNDGKVEIIGTGVGLGVIINLKGQILWKYKITKKYADPDDIVISDINDDGKNEIVVAVQNRIEVYDFDSKKLKWSTKFAEETYSTLTDDRLKVADFNNDGKKEILAGESLIDANGKVIKNFEFFFYWIGIFIQDNQQPQLLGFKDNKIDFTDFDDETIKSYEAPLASLERKRRFETLPGYSLFSINILPVKLSNNEEKYLAILANGNDDEEFGSFMMLYVYDSAGNLVYQETIESFDSEIGILPNDDGTESLMITDDGRLNIYKKIN